MEQNITTQLMRNMLNFRIITFVLSITNVTSILLNLMLLRFQVGQTGLDSSVKILSFNLAVSYMTSNFFLLVKSLLLHTQIETRIEGFECILQEFPVVTGYICSTYNLAAIVLDRWIATRISEKYLKFGVKIAIINVILSWLVASLVYGLNFILPFSNEESPICLSILVGNKHYVTVALALNSFLNWVIFISYRKLISVNRIMLQDFLDSRLYISLSGRLQLRRNIVVAKALLPFILSSALLWLFIEIYILFAMYMSEWTNSTNSFTVAYFNHVLCAFHSLVYPMIVIGQSRSLRTRIKMALKCSCNCNSHQRENELVTVILYQDSQAYFEIMNSRWNTSFIKKQQNRLNSKRKP